MTQSWPLSRQQVLDLSGRPLLIPRAYFYAAGTTDRLTVYADAALSVPLEQPVEADGFGRFPRVYLPQVLYRETVVGPYGEPLWSDDGLGEAAAVDATDPVPAIDPNAVAQTGDIKWRLDGSILPGWVRMNGRTLGGAGSGATELAAASALPAFVYLWTTFSDGIAPVSGGRGTSAAEDFAAGKQIGIPSMRGLVAAGVDDMGSSAANRLQVTTGLSLTAGSTTATVADPTRIARGMGVIGPGVSANTFVAARNGSTVTLSQPAAADAGGTVQARFSLLGDAQMPGGSGGDTVAGLGNDNLPTQLPGGSTSYDPPAFSVTGYDKLVSLRIGDGGTVATVPDVWAGLKGNTIDPGGPVRLDVPISNPAGGVPVTTLQPTRLGTFYMKV